MGDTAIKNPKERVGFAIINLKFEFLKMKIVINLSSSDIKRSDSHFYLVMAVALLIQSKLTSVSWARTPRGVKYVS